MKFIGIHEAVGADPAAGAEWSITVPAGEVWRVRMVAANFTTDGTAANREAKLEIDNGTNTIARYPANLSHTAGVGRFYTFSECGYRGVAAQSNDVNVGIGAHWLKGGDRLLSLTANIQAGDNWTAPRAVVERWA